MYKDLNQQFVGNLLEFKTYTALLLYMKSLINTEEFPKIKYVIEKHKMSIGQDYNYAYYIIHRFENGH